MHQQSNRQLQERTTSLAPAEVLDRAVQFFGRRSGIYSAFPEKRGAGYVVLRGQGGEEIAIGAWLGDGVTMVSGSTYLFDQQVTQFLDALPPAVASTAPPAAFAPPVVIAPPVVVAAAVAIAPTAATEVKA